MMKESQVTSHKSQVSIEIKNLIQSKKSQEVVILRPQAEESMRYSRPFPFPFAPLKVRVRMTKVRIAIFIFGVWILNFSACLSFAFDDQVTSSYQRANVYYEQGNFDQAIRQYNAILERGLASGNLYYNLGNCYFKKGELGRAILNYEKARRLIPWDKDLEFNYEYARSLIKNQSAALNESLLLRVSNNISDKFTIDGLVIFLSIIFTFILVSVLMSLVFRRIKRLALIFAIFLALFFILGLAALREKVLKVNNEAIVIIGQVDAKFEPFDKATTYFILYEGMKVKVTALRDNWYKVKRPDNKSGWIEASAAAIF